MKDRNITVLIKIIQYSNEINDTITRCNLDFDKFNADHIPKNAITMCILQIGELAGKLTPEFKLLNNKIPWRNIMNMRNKAAHGYDEMDMETIWQTATKNIPELKSYCENIVKEYL